MSVTEAFSAVIANAVADWGKSPKSVFRISADAKVAKAKMGNDTLELSTKTGNLTVRPSTGRAVAVIGIGSDGVLRIDCGGGPAELRDKALARAVTTTVEAITAACERAIARGNRTSFTLAPTVEVGLHLHDELDGKSWHWLTTESEIEDEQKAMGHDLEPDEGQDILVSLRGRAGRRIGTALIGTGGVIAYVSKTEMPSGLSGPNAIQARLVNSPDAVDLALGAGEWELEDGTVVLDDRDIVHNAFGPALWQEEDGPDGGFAYRYMLDGQPILHAEYPFAAAARAATDDPSLAGDEAHDTVTKWVVARLDAEAAHLDGQDRADILEIDEDDDFLAADGSTLFDRLRPAATAENVEKLCLLARIAVREGDRSFLVENALANGYLKADHADPKRLASVAKAAGAPAPVLKNIRSFDEETAKSAVRSVMRSKFLGDWGAPAPSQPDPVPRAA